MSQQVASIVQAAEQSILRIRQQVRKDEEVRADYMQRQKEECAREKRRNARALQKRTRLAVSGIIALQTIGRTKELQSFFKTSRDAWRVWGQKICQSPGGDMNDVFYTYCAFILLAEDAVELRWFTASRSNGTEDSTDPGEVFIRIPYAVDDPRKIARMVRPIASFADLSSAYFDVVKGDVIDLLTPEIMFEELTRYSGSTYLEQRFKEGPSPLRLIVDDIIAEERGED